MADGRGAAGMMGSREGQQTDAPKELKKWKTTIIRVIVFLKASSP